MRLGFLLVMVVTVAPAGAATVPTGFTDDVIQSGYARPVSFDFLPDGRVLVAEKETGEVKLVLADGQAALQSVLTVPNLQTWHGEQGLLSVVVDPQWPARPYLYAFYTGSNPNEQRVTRYGAGGALSDGQSGALTFDAGVDLFTGIATNAGNHNGGTLLFGIDGSLFLTLGDDEVKCDAQELDSVRGKVLRMKVDHLGATGPFTLADLAPGDNPYDGQGDIASLVWVYGLRNPFRAHVDPETGHLFVADVGWQTEEEVSVVDQAGVDLGWPRVEGGVLRAEQPCGDEDSAQPPILSYGRPLGSSAISAGVYRAVDGGKANWPEAYWGDYFYVDFYRGNLFRVQGAGQSWAPAPEVPGQGDGDPWASRINRPAQFRVGPDGSLWYVQHFDSGTSTGSLRRIRFTAGLGGEKASMGAVRARFGNSPD